MVFRNFLHEQAVLCPCEHKVVKDNQRSHSLYDRYRPRHHTRVVASTCKQHSILTVTGDCSLLLEQRRHRLECHTEEDVVTVGDAALYSTAVVGARCYCASVVVEDIVLLRTASAGCGKAIAVIETLGCIYRQHRMGQ